MEEIQVEVDYSAERIEFRIEDQTAGFELPKVATLPSAEEESGRGLYLILSLMDDVGYVRRGGNNCLVLQKKVAGV
jgi:anti-sigma regulatory factor (Ser/Thr protein kinase)